MFNDIYQKFSEIFTGHRFQRFMWKVYGMEDMFLKHQVLLKQSQDQKLGVYPAIKMAKEEIISVSKKYNFLSSWLLGFKYVINEYSKISDEIQIRRENLFLQNKRMETRDQGIQKLAISHEKFSSINEHLTNKSKFIQKIPSLKFGTMPQLVERFGRYNQIYAYSCFPGAKMNYINMRKEISAKKKILSNLEKTQFKGYNINNYDTDPSVRDWSDEYDAHSAVIHRCEHQIEKMSNHVVEIDEDGQPQYKTLKS